ncbi:MAG: hypothetical protein H6732_03310 [Alphaproteobacteria bacterium]|nr:hypothetical protein [Alphaproteobacteria bacterium]
MIRALRFLAAQRGLLGPPPPPEVVRCCGWELDVIEPVGRWRGTILTVHGMSPLGRRDPRMLALHGALARIGFRVVSPAFPSIAELRIHAGQIDEVEHALLAVTEERSLCPQGRVALLSVSFSAGLSLIAASRDRVAHRVRAVLSLGAYADIHQTMEAVLTRDDLTSYAWTIVLASFLEAPTPVREALRSAAWDAWWVDRPGWEGAPAAPSLPAALAALAPAERALVDGIMGSPEVRLAQVRKVLDAHPLMLDLASVVDHVGGLRAPVTVLHGLRDRTIPSSQAGTLAQALRAARVPHRVVVSPLLGHGEATFDPAHLLGVPALLGAFEAFFEEAEAGARPAPRVRDLVSARV